MLRDVAFAVLVGISFSAFAQSQMANCYGQYYRAKQATTDPAKLAQIDKAYDDCTAGAVPTAWTYDKESDKMGRGEVKYAAVDSTNEVRFDFPYQGPQRARLLLRVHPQHGRDVILQIEKGQFLCRLDGCGVLVRFDDGKPVRFSALEPADHRTTAIFIQGFDRFVSALRKSKVVRIEASFFQQGSRVFEFDVSGLGSWPSDAQGAAKRGAK